MKALSLQESDELNLPNHYVWFDNAIDIWLKGEEKEFCEEHGLPRIELGGTYTKQDLNVIGVAHSEADIEANIQEWITTVDSNSVGSVRAKDFLEHIPGCTKTNCEHSLDENGRVYCAVGLIKQIHRILVPGGFFISITPSTDGRGAFQDPTHVSFWNQNSFWYYTNTYGTQYRFLGFEEPPFEEINVWTGYDTPFEEYHGILHVSAILRKPR